MLDAPPPVEKPMALKPDAALWGEDENVRWRCVAEAESDDRTTELCRRAFLLTCRALLERASAAGRVDML